jgi:hypothetical protein
LPVIGPSEHGNLDRAPEILVAEGAAKFQRAGEMGSMGIMGNMVANEFNAGIEAPYRAWPGGGLA